MVCFYGKFSFACHVHLSIICLKEDCWMEEKSRKTVLTQLTKVISRNLKACPSFSLVRGPSSLHLAIIDKTLDQLFKMY